MKVPNFMRGGMVVQTFTANEFYFEGFLLHEEENLTPFQMQLFEDQKEIFFEKYLSDLSDFKASSSILGVQNFTNSIIDQSD